MFGVCDVWSVLPGDFKYYSSFPVNEFSELVHIEKIGKFL